MLMPDCSPPKPLSRFGVDAGRLSPALIAGQAAFCLPVGLCFNMGACIPTWQPMDRANPDQCPLIAHPWFCPLPSLICDWLSRSIARRTHCPSWRFFPWFNSTTRSLPNGDYEKQLRSLAREKPRPVQTQHTRGDKAQLLQQKAVSSYDHCKADHGDIGEEKREPPVA